LEGLICFRFNHCRPLPFCIPAGKVSHEKGEIKMHTLYDVETQIPVFVNITVAAVP
jgi:hypothetical protein